MNDTAAWARPYFWRSDARAMLLYFVFGDFPFVGDDGRFELRDGLRQLVVADHAARAQLLSDDTDQILRQILEHDDVRRRTTFECNQHDGPISFVLFASADDAAATLAARGRPAVDRAGRSADMGRLIETY